MFPIAFSLGLISSLHCVGMCGPIALALPVHRGSGWQKVAGLLSYNLGRISTYALLGALIGTVGSTLQWMGYLRYLSVVMGLTMLLYVLWPTRLDHYLRVPAVWQRAIGQLKSHMAAQLRRRSFSGWGVLGMLNGLLPCGLVYLVLISAIATGSTVMGAGYMFSFGLGTVPALMAVGFFQQWFSPALRSRMRRLTPLLIATAGIWLLARGVFVRLPSLSAFSGTTTEIPLCHK